MKAEKIINYLRAGFPMFWIQTGEHDFVREKLYTLIEDFERKDGNRYTVSEWTLSKSQNPLEAITTFCDSQEEYQILFLYNWHWFSEKPQIVQIFKDYSKLLSSQGKAIVCVSHINKIPKELEKEFVLMNLPLPNGEEVNKAIQDIYPENDENKKAQVINACKGLSRSEIDNVLALSVVEEEEEEGYSIDVINEHKAQSIRKTGFLDVIEGNITFDDLIGLDQIKGFVSETIDNPKAKGLIAIGPPGCGKTQLMKAIIGEFKRFGLSVNMGSLFSKYQGETDQNINQVIDIISSIGPCVVLIDEFEKQFAGSNSDGSLDSGTTRRATGRWLDFLQNRPEGVYIVATANSFQGIPNEYLRPGRWDTSPFFIDYPSATVAEEILKHYCNEQNVKVSKVNLNDFSGAEIEALVNIASMRGISINEAIETILPQAKTMGESIDALRKWAEDRTIPAEKKIVKGKTNKKGAKVRRIDR